MDVLISWSGKQSRTVAAALYDWLPKVIVKMRPWMSTKDFDKGHRWFNELQTFLPTAKGCIVCITPENISSPWVYWETGAIATTQKDDICPLLIGVSPDDIRDGPLHQYQCTYDEREDILLLVQCLNQRLENPEEEIRLRGLFDRHWAELHATLRAVVDMGIPQAVLALIRGIENTKAKFARLWETDKAASTTDPIKQLVSDMSSAIEKLVTELKPDSRTVHHCNELKARIRKISDTYNREEMHERGDDIFVCFDKMITAIRANYESPRAT